MPGFATQHSAIEADAKIPAELADGTKGHFTPLQLSTGSTIPGLARGNRTFIKALDTTSITTAYLTEAGREGFWKFESGNYAARVTADTSEGLYMAADDVATTSGAWVRVFFGPVDIRWFGARTGSGNVAANTTAIRAAVDLVMAETTNYKMPLYIPEGDWYINQNIQVRAPLVDYASDGITITGAGKRRAVIKAASGCTKMLEFLGASGTRRHETINLEGFALDASGIADHCVYAPYAAHATYRSIRCISALVSNIAQGYAFCTIFDDIESYYCSAGTGLDLSIGGAQANEVLISNSEISLNAYGLKLIDNFALKILNSDFEVNSNTAIFIRGNCDAISIDTCYFEQNGVTGHTFTSPATVTVHADIIINGTPTDTTISAAFPCHVSVRDNFTSSAVDQFVFAAGAESFIASGNHSEIVTAGHALVTYYGSGTSSPGYGSPKNVDIGPNSGFDKILSITPITEAVLGQTATNYGESVLTVRSHYALGGNLAPSLDEWAVVGASGGGTWQRSSTEFPLNPAAPVWELLLASASNSDFYGFTLDTSKYTKYHDKFMVFGFWVKGPFAAADGASWLYANSAATSASYESNTEWQFKTGVFQMPTTGSKYFSVRKAGASGTIQVTTPVLCEIGADINALIGAYAKKTSFLGTAAPTVGTWLRGDIVWNKTPSAGGPPGWVCVTAGAPGTWSAMANLAP